MEAVLPPEGEAPCDACGPHLPEADFPRLRPRRGAGLQQRLPGSSSGEAGNEVLLTTEDRTEVLVDPAKGPSPPKRPLLRDAGILVLIAGLAGGAMVLMGGQEELPPAGGKAGEPPRGGAPPVSPHDRPPLPPPEVIARLPADGGPEFNRLVFESSPYLLQHARNPVDWYPWGDAAFEKARKEGKAVFLSVGYSTCHWCHVMERESFENEDVAKVLNEHFVSIKVDREERPDVDAVYMAAVQAMTGSGGWPMSVWLAPDGRPFLGGTYFPPEDRFGRPGFKTLLLRVADLWKTRRADLLQDAEKLTKFVRDQTPDAGAVELGKGTLAKAQAQFARTHDAARGGFGGAPKFPRSHALSFLLRHHARTGDPKTLTMVETTLDRMDCGGIHDHLGGGFHRYSTDAEWLVPHFEKMLYDQALLARTYLEAYQVTGKERYAEVARDIFRYVLRDLTDPGGGFHSAEDADSEGEEGKFYVWTKSEIVQILGSADGEFFSRVYGVKEDGNYREEAGGGETRSNILHLPRPVPDIAKELGKEGADLEARLAAMGRRLFEVRGRRVRPHRDDKVLADWNGLMIGALAYGGRILGEPSYTEAARRAADFVLRTMRKDGRLLHRFRAGNAAVPAFLDDYAFLSLGLLDLYEATFEVRWLGESIRLAEEMDRLFWDPKGKGFRLSAMDAESLIAVTKEVYDGAVPSGNSVATLVLLKFGRLTMMEGLGKRADENLRYFSSQIDAQPTAYPFMLQALDFAVGPTREVVLAGPLDDPSMAEMRRAVDRRFLPGMVLAHRPAGDAAAGIVALVPFVEGQVPIDGKPTAYVCEAYACSLPTTDVKKMLSLLEAGR